jgi:hypothetical protein
LHFDVYDNHDLIDSSLNQTYTADGRSVEIHIYRMPNTGWALEAVDDLNNSTVWDGKFATDREALDTAMAEMVIPPKIIGLRSRFKRPWPAAAWV